MAGAKPFDQRMHTNRPSVTCITYILSGRLVWVVMGFGKNEGCDGADELQTDKSRVRLEFEDLGTLL
jgi:hypothetical protein